MLLTQEEIISGPYTLEFDTETHFLCIFTMSFIFFIVGFGNHHTIQKQILVMF